MKLATLAAALVLVVGCSSAKKQEETPAPQEAPPAKNLTSNNVFDAGSYSEKEDISDLKARGGQMFDAIPAEKFYSYDREKLVPVGRLFYVVTDEDPKRCIPAKYSMLDGKKKLVVYSKSTVPATYCIYQKAQSAEAAGFSISVKDGGICMPAIIASKVEGSKTVSTIEFFNKVISMKYCFDETFSFGLGKGHRQSLDPNSELKKKKKSDVPTEAGATQAQ